MRRILLIVVTLALVSYIVWDRIEARRLSNAIAAIAARGEPVTESGSAPAPETAEQREAAALYAQAAELAYERDLEENHRAARLDVDAPDGPEIPIDEIRANYRGDDPATPLLDRATAMDFHGFDADQRAVGRFAGVRASMPDVGLAELGSIACLRADLASIGGDAETAVAALVPCIRLQRTLYRPQFRTTHAVRILGSLRIFFRHVAASDGALATLERAMDSWPEEDTTGTSAMLDRARYVEIVTGQPFPGAAMSIAHILLHPLWLASARRSLPVFDASIAVARRPWAERWSIVGTRQRELLQRALYRRNPGWVARLTDPFAEPFTWGDLAMRSAAAELAARRIAGLAISLERYRRAHGGRLPVSIHPPVDPYSGQPLIVKQDADGYVIYGLDTDRKDDGGIIYGFGAAQRTHIGPQSPRDFGIHVPLNQR